MAGKGKYDWATISREYRTGQFSDAELARRHGCSRTAIQKKVATEGWKRDLAGAVSRATREKIAQADAKVADEVAGCNAKEDATEIELAAETRVSVVRQHRRDISNLQRIEQSLLAELGNDEEPPTKVHITSYQGQVTQTVLGIAVTERASALQALAGAQHKRIQLERQAFSLDDGEEDEDIYVIVKKRGGGGED